MYDEFEGYCDCNPREDWENSIVDIVHETINEKYKEILGEKEYLSKQLSEKNKELFDKKEELNKLKDDLARFEDFNVFLKMINKDNIVSIIEGFNLPITNPDSYISGMDSQEISPYLKLIIKYYDNKDLVYRILKIARVESDIKNLEDFILPRDYDKETTKDILENMSNRMIQTNCCFFDDNFGFWLRGTRNVSIANLSKQVPLQEVLKNKHIVDLFDIIIDLSNKSDKYIFEVTKYQNFNDKQILEMSKYIKDGGHNKLYDTEQNFIKRHRDILFNNKDFCEKYFKYISTNQFNIFSIYEFNKEFQIKYLKEISFKEAIEVINRMKYDDKTKKDIIKAISE